MDHRLLIILNGCRTQWCNSLLNWRWSVGKLQMHTCVSFTHFSIIHNIFIHAYKPKFFCCICGGGRGNGGMCPAKSSTTCLYSPQNTPLSLRPGVPPWNNAGCKMDIVSQLASINPEPKAGGKNAWHPPSQQVRAEGRCQHESLEWLLIRVGSVKLYRRPNSK